MNYLKRIGKSLEWKWREIRSYLLPRDHACYRKLVKHSASLSTPKDKLVLFDLHSIKIDNVGGRYLYRVISDFVALGYTPCYAKRFRFLANFHSKGFKKLLLNIPHFIYDDELQLTQSVTEIILFTDSVSVFDSTTIQNKIIIDYAQRRANSAEIALRFDIHPDQVKTLTDDPDILSEIRNHKKVTRIFFSGRTAPNEYGRNNLAKNFGKLNRLDALKLIMESEQLAHRITSLQSDSPLEALEARHEILIADNRVFKIPPQLWLKTLASSEYFICLSGADMPLCHNLIEALMTGTIPILEYPEYMDPPLSDGVNCLVFAGKENLVATIEKALGLDEATKTTISKNAMAYYDKHYYPGKFAEAMIEAPPERHRLLLNDYRIRRP